MARGKSTRQPSKSGKQAGVRDAKTVARSARKSVGRGHVAVSKQPAKPKRTTIPASMVAQPINRQIEIAALRLALTMSSTGLGLPTSPPLCIVFSEARQRAAKGPAVDRRRRTS